MTTSDDQREPIGVVLAGGASRRMGRDKATVEVDGVASLERVLRAARSVLAEVVVVGGAGGASVIEDLAPGEGPVQALVAAARAYPGRALVVLPCDVPFVDAAVVSALACPLPDDVDARVVSVHDRDQYLCAALGPRALAACEAAFARGDRALYPIFRALRLERVLATSLGPDGAARVTDFDTPESLARLVQLAAVGAAGDEPE